MNRQIHQEACEWFVSMRNGQADASAQGALMAWLKRSPEHVSAYLDIAAIWREAANVQVDGHLTLATRIVQARADGDVAELYSPAPAARKRYFPRGRSVSFAVAAALALAVLAAFVLVPGRTSVYATQVGELRSVTLPDGSIVELNSQSTIEIDFTADRRSVSLLDGQALFKVTKDAARPFTVASGSTLIRAVGTQFDVYRKHASKQIETVVTVLEGKVAVGTAPGAQLRGAGAVPEILLAYGEQLTVMPGRVQKPMPANVAAATAWARRQLIFEFTPLAQVAEEFNRYNSRKLTVEDDAQLRAFKISAIFESTDPSALVRFLRGTSGLEVIDAGDSISIARKEDPERGSRN